MKVARPNPWNIAVRHKMVDINASTGDVAKNINRTSAIVSAVITGRLYSVPTMKAINKYLSISDDLLNSV